MSLFSGAKLTDADIDARVQREVRLIVKRLSNGEVDPPDAIQQLVTLIVRAANAMKRLQAAQGE